MALAGEKLPTSPIGAAGLAGADREAAEQLFDQRLELVGVGRLPGGVSADVAEGKLPASTLLGRIVEVLVEWIRRVAGPAAAATGHHDPVEPLGVPNRQLLGHHPAERDAHDVAAV